MRISDWSSDVCSSDLGRDHRHQRQVDDDRADPPYPGDGGHPQPVRRQYRAADPRTAALARRRRLRTRTVELSNRFDAEPRLRCRDPAQRSEEHTSELQSLMRISYAVFCLKKKKIYKCHIYTIKN